MADLRTDLERIGRRVEPTGDALERLERRRRTKERNRRLAAGGLALLIAIGGSIAAYSALRDDGPGGLVVGAAGQTGTTDAVSNVARVTCDGSSTVVFVVEMDPQTGEFLAISSAVRPQLDGVHVLVKNTSGRDLLFQWELGGDNAPEGERELVLPVPPGVSEIRCQDPAEDGGAPDGYVELEVVDPDGIYVSTELECGSKQRVGWINDFIMGATGDPDPVASARERLQGLEPDDLVEAAGYPKAQTPQVRVVRDGKVVAVVDFLDDGQGGWLLGGGEACDVGIG